MITIKKLSEVYWDIGAMNITARDNTLKYIHTWVFTPEDPEYMGKGLRWDCEKGAATYIWCRVNAYGKDTKKGTETGHGLEDKLIPELLADAQVAHLDYGARCKDSGYMLYVDVVLEPMTAEAITEELRTKNGKIGNPIIGSGIFDFLNQSDRRKYEEHCRRDG